MNYLNLFRSITRGDVILVIVPSDCSRLQIQNANIAGVLSDLMWDVDVPANDAKVLLLGWSYKAEIGDPRETPAETVDFIYFRF
jgi:hypothetical protein